MKCELTDDARPSLNLGGPGLRALAQNHTTLLVGHAIDTLRRLYPALAIRLTDSNRAERGWLQPDGESVINLRHARPDTPFHEVGHLWEAVLNDQLPADEYDAILNELNDSPQLAQARQLYAEQDDRLQRREALVQLLGEQAYAATAMRGGLPDQQRTLRALAQRVYSQLRNALTPLLGPPALLELPLHQRSLQAVLRQGVKALTDTPSPVLGSAYAKRLITETLQQRVSAARNPGELMELLTGSDPQNSDKQVQNLAAKAEAKARDEVSANNGLKYRLPDGRGLHSYPAGVNTQEERQNHIADKIRQAQQEAKLEMAQDVVDFFGRPAVEQARLLRGDYATEAEEIDKGKPDEKQRQKTANYYRVVQQLFPDFEEGDEITHFADGGNEFYQKTVDMGGVLLHRAKRKDPVTGTEKVVVSLAATTDGPLGEMAKDSSFLAGLYDGKGLGGFFRSLAVRFGFEVKLPASHENRVKMQLLLTAMHLREQGFQVNGLAVGKFNQNAIDQNQAVAFWPTEHLQTYKVIRTLEPVRNALKGSGEQGEYLLRLLDNDALYDASDYALDPLRHLSDHYKASIPPAEAIRKALGGYYADKSAASFRSLNLAIRRRLKELINSSVGNQYREDKEFLMLSDAMVQLAGVSYYTNPWKVMDRVTSLYTSFLRHTNPLMQYFVNEWDNHWYRVAQQFTDLQAKHRQVTDELHEWHRSRHAGAGVTEHLFEQNQAKYYDDLFVKQELDYFNGTDYEKKTINTFRLLLPESDGFKALQRPQQEYIRWALGAIKERVTAVERQRRQNENKTYTEKEIAEWYEQNWGDGRVPVVKASVWQSVLKGDIAYASEQQLRSLFEDNPRFFDQQADQEDHLTDYILTQSNDDQRNRLLGLQPTADKKGLELADNGGLEVHNQLETDMRRVMNIVMMQTLKQELTSELDLDMRVGQALIRHHDTALGLARSEGQGLGSIDEDNAGGTQTEKNFLQMARMIWLNRTNQNKGSGLEKRLTALAAVAGSLTSSAILLGNVMVPIQTFLTTSLGNLLPQALAAAGFESKTNTPSIQSVNKAVAIVSTPSNWEMLQAMAKQLGVTRHGEFDLLSQRKNTGEPLRVFSSETAYSLDHWGDDLLRVTTMVAMLEQQGIYQNYSWDAETKTLKYDVERDKKVRGEKVVQAVRDGLEREGVLAPGAPLDRAFDGTLRRTMEGVIGDILAGYSPLTQTTLGATALGSQVRKLAGYMPMRIERALQDRQKTPGKTTYDSEGRPQQEEEVGQLRSLFKRMAQGTIESMGLVSKESRGERLSTADQLNLRNLTMNLGLFASFSAAAVAAGIALDDDKKNQKRTMALKLLDSLIMETFAFENFRMILGKAANPFITMTMLKNMADTLSSAMLPGKDSGQGWHQLSGRLGVKRLADAVGSAFEE